MTRLASIPDHHVWLLCACSHSALVDVSGLLAHGADRDMTVGELRDRARCVRCGARGHVIDLRIVWVGASGHALFGGHGGIVRSEDTPLPSSLNCLDDG